MSKDPGYVVEVRVYLFGGQAVVTRDAFRALSRQEAENLALNTFIQGHGAVIYGDAAIVLDAMCAVEVIDSVEIDLAEPKNRGWLESIELFERMLDEESKTNRSGEATPWAGPEEPVQGR